MDEDESKEDVIQSEGKLRAQEAVAAITCHTGWGADTHMALIATQGLYLLGAVTLMLPEEEREEQMRFFLSKVSEVVADLTDAERNFNEQQESSAYGRGTSEEPAG